MGRQWLWPNSRSVHLSPTAHATHERRPLGSVSLLENEDVLDRTPIRLAQMHIIFRWLCHRLSISRLCNFKFIAYQLAAIVIFWGAISDECRAMGIIGSAQGCSFHVETAGFPSQDGGEHDEGESKDNRANCGQRVDGFSVTSGLTDDRDKDAGPIIIYGGQTLRERNTFAAFFHRLPRSLSDLNSKSLI